MEGKRLEYVLSTHCDELVAAARAEGAREAQAKIARLTEALNEKQDDGKNFWMNWTQKRLEINRAMFLRDAKLALAGDMRALRNRVELMEAEPVPIVLSSALQENANG
jgi:C4-dicarboxylate-specific signal transduction histidine kinase